MVVNPFNFLRQKYYISSFKNISFQIIVAQMEKIIPSA